MAHNITRANMLGYSSYQMEGNELQARDWSVVLIKSTGMYSVCGKLLVITAEISESSSS